MKTFTAAAYLFFTATVSFGAEPPISEVPHTQILGQKVEKTLATKETTPQQRDARTEERVMWDAYDRNTIRTQTKRNLEQGKTKNKICEPKL